MPLPTQSVLVFAAGEAWYALPSASAGEIVTLPQLTKLPGAQPHMLGVFAHRGEVLPVLDLGMMLGEPPLGSNRVVVVRVERGAFALLATRIAAVQEIPHKREALGPLGISAVLSEPVELDGRQVTVLDVEGLFAMLAG